ncbi:hypothetical protein B0T11DRAFT_303022 [Plectosphaerella cucumerina]|uniref:Uncharacterized protein n=1 Tax=Plectosphaerella cucumerina TaxID=40658 RepID=A0A8K0T9D5_9PEZI|nr:hypothetical protein B0T11DRAFT_303022 [Plectosphaerella cucumerina]
MSLPVRCMPCLALLPCQGRIQAESTYRPASTAARPFKTIQATPQFHPHPLAQWPPPARPEHQDTAANADIGWMDPDLKETNEKRSSHARRSPPSQADLSEAQGHVAHHRDVPGREI